MNYTIKVTGPGYRLELILDNCPSVELAILRTGARVHEAGFIPHGEGWKIEVVER